MRWILRFVMTGVIQCGYQEAEPPIAQGSDDARYLPVDGLLRMPGKAGGNIEVFE